MQVITVSEFGGPEVLKVSEAPLPQPGPGEVLVRVLAAGVGPWDASLRAGGWTGSLPYVPGGEFAGVVVGDTGADRRAHGRAGADRRAGRQPGGPRADHRRGGRARSLRGADRPDPRGLRGG